jgi:hypothetical protein
MALSQSTLSTELQNIANATSEPPARAAFAAAFSSYMLGATSNGAPLNGAIATAAEAAMEVALAGMSADGAAATAIQTGVIAYWAALNVPTAFGASVSPTVPPTGLAGLGAALSAVFATNISGSLDKAPACDAIAAVWHPLMLGGLATFLTPPPVTFPIL